jgi:hypothetical protein
MKLFYKFFTLVSYQLGDLFWRLCSVTNFLGPINYLFFTCYQRLMNFSVKCDDKAGPCWLWKKAGKKI